MPDQEPGRSRDTTATDSSTDGEAARKPPHRTIISSPSDSSTARIEPGPAYVVITTAPPPIFRLNPPARQRHVPLDRAPREDEFADFDLSRVPPRAFLMALAVIAVVPPATMAGIYYWIVIHEGSPLLAASVVATLPFALRALICGWLRNPPAVRRAPELSGPSQPVPAEAWDAIATLATRQADLSC